jgi:hypothetical protein
MRFNKPLLAIILTILVIMYIQPLLCYVRLPRISFSRLPNQRTMTLYRTWRDRFVTSKMLKNCHQRWLDLNSNLKIEWYSDKDCDRFMHSQGREIWDAYNMLRPGAFKADLFRLCILYKHGGIYADACTMPYMSIRNMITGCYSSNNPLFISVKDAGPSNAIHNGFIIAEAKHPFLLACIQRIVRNVQELDYTDHNLGITGPVCLGRSINTFLGRDEEAGFHQGWNEHGNLSFYLYRFQWGPFQYIYKGNQKILSKKHCTLSYFLDKMKVSSYTKMYRNRTVYNI